MPGTSIPKVFFLLSPKVAARNDSADGKKSARVSFPTTDLAESNPIVAEPPETARPVGREITFLEELACCPALLESDTHEEVCPRERKEAVDVL